MMLLELSTCVDFDYEIFSCHCDVVVPLVLVVVTLAAYRNEGQWTIAIRNGSLEGL